MLSLARLAVRSVSTTQAILPSYPILRHYGDDAGPSTRGLKSRKQQLRKVISGQVGKKSSSGLSLNDLQTIMDAPTPAPRPRPITREPREFPTPKKELGFGIRDGRRPPKDDWVASQHYGQKDDTTPYQLSQKVHKWIQRHESPLSPRQVDEVEAIVTEARLSSVNAAVYNLIFALLGREGKYQRMWKVFNNMKKRGVRPTSRTFTTLLNAYAGLSHSGVQAGQFTPSHPPESLTLDRVRIIYEQSQAHIRAKLAEGEPEDDDGLAMGSSKASQPKVKEESQINVLPTNAYLKFLARFGKWEEMERVFLAMDTSGPLAPDQITYFTMFKTISNIAIYHSRSTEDSPLPVFNIGSTSRGYWDRAVRQLSPKPGKDLIGGRKLDEALALSALQCFSLGGPADHRLVEKLIPRLYLLPVPGQPASSSNSIPEGLHLPDAWAYLPTFKLSVQSGTTLMAILKRIDLKSITAHYTHIFLNNKRLQKDFDLHALRAIVHNLSASEDAEAALAVLDMYQPPTGKDGWPLDVWQAVISAARWSADWDTALTVFRRMVHLPFGIELEETPRPYTFEPPNGSRLDVRGRPWVVAQPLRADVATLDLLLKTALAAQKSSGIKPLRQAMAIYEYFATGIWKVPNNIVDSRGGHVKDSVIDLLLDSTGDLTKATKRYVAQRLDLAADLETATERLIELPRSEQETAHNVAIQKEAQQVQKNWKWVWNKQPQDKRKQAIAARGIKPNPPREELSEKGTREFKGDREGEDRRPRFEGERSFRREERDDRPRFQGEGNRTNRPQFRRDGEQGEGDRPRFQRDGEREDRPRFQRSERTGSDRPRFQRNEYRPRDGDEGRERRPFGDKPRFERRSGKFDGRGGGSKPRYEQQESE